MLLKFAGTIRKHDRHFELTPDLFNVWVEQDADLSRMDQSRLKQEFEAISKTYLETGTRLVENFFKIAGLLNSTAPLFSSPAERGRVNEGKK